MFAARGWSEFDLLHNRKRITLSFEENLQSETKINRTNANRNGKKKTNAWQKRNKSFLVFSRHVPCYFSKPNIGQSNASSSCAQLH